MLRHCVRLALLGSLSVSPVGATAGALEKEPIPLSVGCAGQVRYLSDTDSAFRYLENKQREIYKGNPDLTDPFSRAELAKPRSVANFAELKKRALEACPDPSKRDKCVFDPDIVDRLMADLPCLSLSTRFESPLFFSLITINIKILKTVRLSHFPASSDARFGSLPTGTIDAQAVLPPNSKNPLVILNRDIFFFTGAVSKSISDAIPISESGAAVSLDYSEEGIRKRLRDHPYIVANFADALSRIVRAGSSVGASEVTLDEDHNHIHARLVSAMDMFIIAHEDAHVILGHVNNASIAFRLAGEHAQNTLGRAARPRKSNSKGKPRQSKVQGEGVSTTLRAQLRTREQELEADALGFRLMMWSEETKNDPIAQMMAAAAPSMVFRIMDAADAYGREAGGWGFSDANHPPATDRANALSSVFDELARGSELLQEADFRVPFDAALKVLLAEADPQIRQSLGLSAKPISKPVQ